MFDCFFVFFWVEIRPSLNPPVVRVYAISTYTFIYMYLGSFVSVDSFSVDCY